MIRMPVWLERATLAGVYALPRPLRRLIAGPAIRIDGQELALDAQLLLRMANLTGFQLTGGSPAQARRTISASSSTTAGPAIEPVRVRDLTIAGVAGPIPARLYVPEGPDETTALLVYYHGGGWVIGSIDSHDNVCRFLARYAGVRVLSVGYRLAPEHPFPAGPQDALTAFEYATGHAGELGTEPTSIAVGGDSAGATLATVTAYQAVRAGGPRPAFQLLFYPGTDMPTRYRSEDLFAKGFFLTAQDIHWFSDHYCPDQAARHQPLVSPLLADDVRGMPPTYVVTAGFDPLRDEGAAYARRLRAAGVPVVYRCQEDLVHGFVNFTGLGGRFREAMAEAAATLRAGLVLGTPPASGQTAGPAG